jgi:hypothetical protein
LFISEVYNDASDWTEPHEVNGRGKANREREGRRMRRAAYMILLVVVCGCTSTYKSSTLVVPSTKLERGKSVVIATPANGSYGDKEYAGSGKMTALAVRSAFAKFTNTVTLSTECKDLNSLRMSGPSQFDYYIVPEVLHWEDRATEWSGVPDRIEILLSVYEGTTWKELASVSILGKSKWATFGGDNPQDLLEEPINKYVRSLY